MKKIILMLPFVALISCTDVRTESTGTLHEKAVVVTTLYSPSEHKTELTNTAYGVDGQDGIIGNDYNGNQGVRIGKNVQLTTTTIPEKYGVVFQCEHGTFTIEGSEQKHRVLYQKLLGNVRDTVDILYKEQYLVTYEKDKKTNKDVEVKRVLNKLDFIDAQVINRR